MNSGKYVWAVVLPTLLAATDFAAAQLPPLIPRSILFGNPQKTEPQLSPDGKLLAYIAPDDRDVLQVWVRTVGKDDDRKVTADKKRGIRSYFWTYDGRQLIYLQDKEGDENFHLHGVNVATKEARDLTPFDGVRAQIIDVDPRFPREVLIGLNKKDKSKFDVHRLNLDSGDLTLETSNPGNIVGWTADANFKIRVAMEAAPDGGMNMLYRSSPEEKWKQVKHWGVEEQGSPLGFSADNKTLYVLANHDANTQRLLAVDVATWQETVMASDPSYDVGGALVHPMTRVIQAVSFNRDMKVWQVLDKSIEGDFNLLIKSGPQFSVTNRDLADKTWLVAYSNDRGSVAYYAYDRATRKTTLLFSQQPKLEGLVLAEMQPISYQSRDGLTIHGYLTTPPGVPLKGLPTVLLVHGGPWARDSWGYNATVQWLANRGYAVLQVNFRGSTGYGKNFLNAGNKEWGGKMHLDLIDGVDWLIKKEWADPKKVAIMGGSYGGYATLAGLTFTPDVFACGVDIVGPSNIVSLIKTIPPYWGPLKGVFAKRVGDLDKEEDFLKSRSPLFFVDKIKAPLLIGQGANDPRVKQAESDQIVAAMRKANKTVEYIIYTDEGHGFARPENRMHFFAHTEVFLSRHLGGRAEPLGEIKGNSAMVK